MSHDVEGESEKVRVEHLQSHGTLPNSELHTEEEDDDQLQLLAMEELVPITQSLITPTLSRLFDLNSHQHLPQNIQPAERSLHTHYEELQQMQLQEDDPSKGEEDHDFKDGADDCCLQIMMGTPLMEGKPGALPSGYKRSHMNAGLIDSYGAQLDDDGTDEHAEGFGMNHLLERENSSNSGDGTGSGGGGGSGSARTLKRPRLVWTPQLHKRFVDAVSHLGIKNAVPKTIMQLMNVEGLTRENVASHLQKYRLYLRRVQQGNLFPSCTSSSNKSILGGVQDHHHQLIGVPLSPAVSSDHLFSSSSIPCSSNTALTKSLQSHHPHAHPHSHHHRPPGHISHLIPNQHMQNLLMQQPQHQLNPAMAMVKSPPLANQHLINPQRFNANADNSGSPTLRPSWSSSHASILDINALNHVESHGTTAGPPSSPPRRALTLFPH